MNEIIIFKTKLYNSKLNSIFADSYVQDFSYRHSDFIYSDSNDFVLLF